MESARQIFFDLLFHFIVYGYFLSVNDFFYSLAVFVLACNLCLYGYFFVVVFLLDSIIDQALRNLADLL